MPSGTAFLIGKQKNERSGYLKLVKTPDAKTRTQSAERSNFYKLSSDLHTPAVAHVLSDSPTLKKNKLEYLSPTPALQCSLIPLRKNNIIKTTTKQET